MRTKKLLKFAIITRLLVFIITYLFDLLFDDHDTSTVIHLKEIGIE